MCVATISVDAGERRECSTTPSQAVQPNVPYAGRRRRHRAGKPFAKKLKPSVQPAGLDHVVTAEVPMLANKNAVLQIADRTRSSASKQRGRERAKQNVTFDVKPPVMYEIPAYAEIYGLHPRDFVFDRGFYMVPAYNFIPMDVLAARHWARLRGQQDIDSEDEAENSESSDDEDAF